MSALLIYKVETTILKEALTVAYEQQIITGMQPEYIETDYLHRYRYDSAAAYRVMTGYDTEQKYREKYQV